jgi:hypothetical protein
MTTSGVPQRELENSADVGSTAKRLFFRTNRPSRVIATLEATRFNNCFETTFVTI